MMEDEPILWCPTLVVCQPTWNAAHYRPLHECEDLANRLLKWLRLSIQLALDRNDVALVHCTATTEIRDQAVRGVGEATQLDPEGGVEVSEVVQLPQELRPPLGELRKSRYRSRFAGMTNVWTN